MTSGLKFPDRQKEVQEAVDQFWRDNHYPPSVRDIMLACKISSTFLCNWYMRRLKNVRRTKNGKVIPEWVDQLFEREKK